MHDRKKLRLATIRETWIPALAGYYQDGFRTVVARKWEWFEKIGHQGFGKEGGDIMSGTSITLKTIVELIYYGMGNFHKTKGVRLVT
jgi:hypothetical protein